ncbi:DDE superfamily endonuclease [Popillia japonica]|uniref:DDE superfamily endonuclease n=1 Tax=Popillia japonica TaxID=7064 RepID=A0AAW1HSY2_POPJA
MVPRQSRKHQRLIYSSYNHRNSFKGLVGVAPNGVVTFASSLYPGSTSDKNIVKHCGILKQLKQSMYTTVHRRASTTNKMYCKSANRCRKGNKKNEKFSHFEFNSREIVSICLNNF